MKRSKKLLALALIPLMATTIGELELFLYTFKKC